MADRPDRLGRGRLSSLDLLPEEATDDVIWACEQLALRTRTQSDILFELNDRLEAKGIEPISRSAFNRKAMRLAAAQRRMAEARAMFEGLATQFTAENVDEHTIVLGEYLKTLVIELLDDSAADRTPKQAMELARAFQSIVSAQAMSAERRRKLQAEFRKETEKTIEAVAHRQGLSRETVDLLRSEFLGIEPQKAPEPEVAP